MFQVDHKVFYSSYAVDYHIYKVASLESILNDCQRFKEQFLESVISGTDVGRFERFIKSEIRITCFHAIETLFELIFALEPKEGVLQDQVLLKSLATANFTKNYQRITTISNDLSALDFLDATVSSEPNSPLWAYLFYYGVSLSGSESDTEMAAANSWTAIKSFLSAIASLFSNRDEYNAYKHGLRILNTVTEFSIATAFDPNPVVEDMSDTMSYFTVEKEEKKPVAELVNIVEFHTDTDIEIIKTCSMLMSNIIGRRREVFHDLPVNLGWVFTESEMAPLISATRAAGNLSMQMRTPLR